MNNNSKSPFYFRENLDKYSSNMLDRNMNENENNPTLRNWIMSFSNTGYYDNEIDLDSLSDDELSHLVDSIEYLEDK